MIARRDFYFPLSREFVSMLRDQLRDQTVINLPEQDVMIKLSDMENSSKSASFTKQVQLNRPNYGFVIFTCYCYVDIYKS